MKTRRLKRFTTASVCSKRCGRGQFHRRLESPRRFGRYLILRELGRGAFGVVFLASDSVLGRKVALKVPRPLALVTPEVRRRFVREAEAASRLDHPHIVPVYDVGEEGPICYIASAYCEGPNLADWLRGQSAPVPFLEAARLVAILSTAVGHAHERGILHRDLKPGNILLRPPDPTGSERRRCVLRSGFRSPHLRLRTGEAARPGFARDLQRRADRLTELHGTRAGRRTAARPWPGDRCLRPGSDPLRAADRQAALEGRDRPGDIAAGRRTRTRLRRAACGRACRAISRRSV